MSTGSPHIFSAKIYKVWNIRFVDVPPEITRSLGSGKERIPVSGTIENLRFRTTLVPSGNNRHRMAIHGEIYKKLRIDAGAIVEVSIELDEESREPALPPSLIVALKHSPKANKVFRGFTTALRRQIVRYLIGAKSVETVERRVAKFVLRLERGDHQREREKARENSRRKKLQKTAKPKSKSRKLHRKI